MPTYHAPAVHIQVPVYYHYPQAEAARVAPPPASPVVSTDTFIKPRVRPFVVGNDVFFAPVRDPDEPSLATKLFNWLFGS